MIKKITRTGKVLVGNKWYSPRQYAKQDILFNKEFMLGKKVVLNLGFDGKIRGFSLKPEDYEQKTLRGD